MKKVECGLFQVSRSFLACATLLLQVQFLMVTSFQCTPIMQRGNPLSLALGPKSDNEKSMTLTRLDMARVMVIGGGASGMFAAAEAAKSFRSKSDDFCNQDFEVIVLECTKHTMTKVSISGGGRCNVLHDTRKATPEILSCYPRGRKELNGIFSKHFTPQDARHWFESKGVQLKTESDGRMFPTTDNSQTIIDAIYSAAEKEGVKIMTQSRVLTIEKNLENDLFYITFQSIGKTQKIMECDSVILATGSSKAGYDIVESLGHTIVQPVPSLFTLSSKEHVGSESGILHGLSGVSVPFASVTLKVKVPGKKKKQMITQEGPLLLTHHGISGPAALRLSAFAAREFHDCNYQTSDVVINWIPKLSFLEHKSKQKSNNLERMQEILWEQTFQTPKRLISSSCPFYITEDKDKGTFMIGAYEESNNPSEKNGGKISLLPKRLWNTLVSYSGLDKSATWAEAPKKKIFALARNLYEFKFHVTSKGVFKEEFVTAGGVKLREIKMDTMASKKCEGLFLCGEVIDVDGITGGFNFMNCWSTGYLAGRGTAEYVTQRLNVEE